MEGEFAGRDLLQQLDHVLHEDQMYLTNFSCSSCTPVAPWQLDWSPRCGSSLADIRVHSLVIFSSGALLLRYQILPTHSLSLQRILNIYNASGGVKRMPQGEGGVDIKLRPLY